MVVAFELMFFTLWVLCWQCLVLVQGHEACLGQCVHEGNITSELQSDVLLPCNFEPTLLGSDKTADIAAVWSQKTIPADNLVEIKLMGEVRFWTNRNGRIKTFPKLSESGNFSILLHNVSESDLGLYHCELFKGINCSIAYQDVQLGLSTVSAHFYQTSMIAGTSGAVVILLLIILVFYIASKRRRRSETDDVCEHTRDHPIYENCSSTVQDSQSREGLYTQYATVQHSQSREEDHVYENPISTRGTYLDKRNQRKEENQ